MSRDQLCKTVSVCVAIVGAIVVLLLLFISVLIENQLDHAALDYDDVFTGLNVIVSAGAFAALFATLILQQRQFRDERFHRLIADFETVVANIKLGEEFGHAAIDSRASDLFRSTQLSKKIGENEPKAIELFNSEFPPQSRFPVFIALFKNVLEEIYNQPKEIQARQVEILINGLSIDELRAIYFYIATTEDDICNRLIQLSEKFEIFNRKHFVCSFSMMEVAQSEYNKKKGSIKKNMTFAIYPSLKGKSVLISGGASGIGAEIVKAFAAQGSKVGFLDFDAEGSEQLIAETEGDISYVHCDLRDIPAMQAAIKTLANEIGPPAVLVNNAARDDRHDWRDVTPEYWDERQATNIRHMFFAIQAVAPGMIDAGGGSIINMGSNSWWEAGGGFPAYTTAKAAVHGLTRTMARDLGDHRIRVNCIVPGWIMTERQKELWATPEALEKHRERQCLPDLIEPVYLARMALFLASDDSAMCTASNFLVEAGSM